jgi:hypothetical protein
MCPSFMATREELHLTRGRARLLFEMLQGNPLGGSFTLIIVDGFSCREQITQLAGRDALHLAEVIQMAISSRSSGGSQ